MYYESCNVNKNSKTIIKMSDHLIKTKKYNILLIKFNCLSIWSTSRFAKKCAWLLEHFIWVFGNGLGTKVRHFLKFRQKKTNCFEALGCMGQVAAKVSVGECAGKREISSKLCGISVFYLLLCYEKIKLYDTIYKILFIAHCWLLLAECLPI